jgi:sialidase-1
VQVVATDGKNSLNNPQVVALRNGGHLLLMYQRYPYGYHSRIIADWYRPEGLKSVLPGYGGENICRSFLCTSDDEGRSWSQPRETTRQVKNAGAASIACGPGIGIELRRGAHAGRLLMPFNQRRADRSTWDVYAAFSDDQGRTWQRGAIAPDGSKGSANEVQFAELADGSVLLNARSAGGARCRKTAVSRDGGRSWSPLEDVPSLVEPECMGSILRYGEDGGSAGPLLYSGPASAVERANGSIWVSRDEGATWGGPRTICSGRFAYSCLATLPDGKVGCLYETGSSDPYERIVLASFSPDWVGGV